MANTASRRPAFASLVAVHGHDAQQHCEREQRNPNARRVAGLRENFPSLPKDEKRARQRRQDDLQISFVAERKADRDFQAWPEHQQSGKADGKDPKVAGGLTRPGWQYVPYHTPNPVI